MAGIRIMREISKCQADMLDRRPMAPQFARQCRGGHKTLIALERRAWVEQVWPRTFGIGVCFGQTLAGDTIQIPPSQVGKLAEGIGLRWHPDAAGIVWCTECRAARWRICYACEQIGLPEMESGGRDG